MIEAANLQNRSVEFALFLTLPAAGALLVMSEAIVRVLYERGAFSTDTTHSVAAALAVFGLGLPAFVMIKAFTPGFFAREDTKTPMRFAAISVAVNVALALALFPIIHEAGIATAEATAGWLNAMMLLAALVRRGHWTRDEGLIRRVPRLVVATAIMAVALHFGVKGMASWLTPQSPLLTQASALMILIVAGMAIYFGAAFAIGGAEFGMIRRNIKRGRKPAE
jgi:putative peptidoglycan lipid II flippase